MKCFELQDTKPTCGLRVEVRGGGAQAADGMSQKGTAAGGRVAPLAQQLHRRRQQRLHRLRVLGAQHCFVSKGWEAAVRRCHRVCRCRHVLHWAT